MKQSILYLPTAHHINFPHCQRIHIRWKVILLQLRFSVYSIHKAIFWPKQRIVHIEIRSMSYRKLGACNHNFCCCWNKFQLVEKSQIQMEIIRVIYKYWIRMGLTPQQSIRNHPFNIRNSAILFIYGIQLTFNTMYLIHDAATLDEYADSIDLISMSTLGVSLFSYATWKMAEIYQFTENLEDLVDASA